ncbi:MAG: hypothetical protein ACJ76X_08700 [Solirubrobacteraceae bacterium]
MTIGLRVAGSLRARVARDGHSADFVSADGRVVLRYAGLSVADARGRSLRAWLARSASGLLIRVDDRGARYPSRIDPLVQQGPELVGSGAVGMAGQGYSVALSADGNTALVGGHNDSGGTGAVWVFTRSGTTWS